MTASSPLPAPQLLPLARYRDLGAALDWLSSTFGFEKHVAVSDADGQVIYAQVTYGGSMMMLGAVRDTDLDGFMRQPDEVGGVETQSCYVVVADADEHHQRAVEAGAEIVLELKSDGLGRRGYSCRDPEGHLWSFGTYDPARAVAVQSITPEQPAARATLWPRRAAMAVGLLLAGAIGWGLHAAMMPGGLVSLARMDEAERAYTELSKVRAEKRSVEATLAAARGELAAERKARATAEAAADSARKQVKAEQEAKASLEKARDELSSELERVKTEKETAEAGAKKAAADLAVEREARVALEHETAAAQQAEVDQRMAAAAAAAANGSETSQTVTSKMETSATTLDGEQKEPLAKTIPVVKKPRQSRPRKGPVPTYMIELSDVPWPYTAWHGK